MTSSKQHKAALRARQRNRDAPRAHPADARHVERPPDAVAVDRDAVVRFNSYGPPDWYQRGYYTAAPFTCVDCGAAQVWTATQQKWWYEVAKGQPFSFAKRCRICRQARRQPKHQRR